MLSKILLKIYEFSLSLEKPNLFNVKRKGGLTTLCKQLDKEWFYSLDIDTVIDIGANTGQFTKTISVLLPNAKIYSFEPIPSCFDELYATTQNNSNVQVFNVGLGDKSGMLSFQYNSFSAASSFLKSTDELKKTFPFASNASEIEVRISRLDDISEELKLGTSILAKIDVQGYEDKVLAGGEITLRESKIIIIETSFDTLYKEQPLFNDIYQTLVNWGFAYTGNIDQLDDPKSGKPLQCDAVFIKS
jgi:FkbM family methyltransferase